MSNAQRARLLPTDIALMLLFINALRSHQEIDVRVPPTFLCTIIRHDVASPREPHTAQAPGKRMEAGQISRSQMGTKSENAQPLTSRTPTMAMTPVHREGVLTNRQGERAGPSRCRPASPAACRVSRTLRSWRLYPTHRQVQHSRAAMVAIREAPRLTPQGELSSSRSFLRAPLLPLPAPALRAEPGSCGSAPRSLWQRARRDRAASV